MFLKSSSDNFTLLRLIPKGLTGGLYTKEKILILIINKKYFLVQLWEGETPLKILHRSVTLNLFLIYHILTWNFNKNLVFNFSAMHEIYKKNITGSIIYV